MSQNPKRIRFDDEIKIFGFTRDESYLTFDRLSPIGHQSDGKLVIDEDVEQMDNTDDNDIDGQQKESFNDCLHNLESIMSEVIEFIDASEELEKSFIRRLDDIIEEAIRTKQTTEEEAKQFCKQLKTFADFVNVSHINTNQ